MEKFLSNDNKRLLWSILYEQGIFQDIPSNEFENIKSIFETLLGQTANQYKETNNPDISLVDINKLAIKDISQKMAILKLKFSSNPAKSLMSTNVLNSQIRETRQDKFNKILQSKQSEFTDLIQSTKPEAPKFTEDMDKPFDKTNMDTLLNEMMSAREKELNQVMQNVPVPEIQDNTAAPILNIGSAVNSDFNITNIYMEPSKENKHVSFEIESDNTIIHDKFVEIDLGKANEAQEDNTIKSLFMDKLKKMTDVIHTEYESERLFNESVKQNNSMSDQLNKISSNQSKLLELFNVINTKQNTILERLDQIDNTNKKDEDIDLNI